MPEVPPRMRIFVLWSLEVNLDMVKDAGCRSDMVFVLSSILNVYIDYE